MFEIFNGEPAAEIALKMQTKAIFERGLQDYFAKDFAEAAVQFKNVLKEHPTDLSARLYLERSARLMVQGVPAEWQGIETIEY